MSDGKSGQVLSIEPPQELLFKGPFTDVVTSPLRLTNPTEKDVCFKVKTTAPKQYCVRPNSGIVKPGETAEVSIMLQPAGSDISAMEPSRHKFMVQTCYAPGENVDLEGLWKTVPSTDLMYTKLRVVFDMMQNKGDGDHSTTKGADETTVSSLNYSAQQSPQTAPNTFTPSAGASKDLEQRLRAEKTARSIAESDCAAIKKELDAIMQKYTKLNERLASSSGEAGMPTIQVFLLAIAGLLLGLIIGKLI